MQILPSGTFQGRSFANRWLRGMKTLVTKPRLYINVTVERPRQTNCQYTSFSSCSASASKRVLVRNLNEMSFAKRKFSLGFARS